MQQIRRGDAQERQTDAAGGSNIVSSKSADTHKAPTGTADDMLARDFHYPYEEGSGQLVADLMPDFDFHSIKQHAPVKNWATQRMCEILREPFNYSSTHSYLIFHEDEQNVTFRGSKAGGNFTLFPWSDLQSKLTLAQCRIVGWPSTVRLPGDTSLSKPSFSGLDKTEMRDFTNALVRNTVCVEQWPGGL